MMDIPGDNTSGFGGGTGGDAASSVAPYAKLFSGAMKGIGKGFQAGGDKVVNAGWNAGGGSADEYNAATAAQDEAETQALIQASTAQKAVGSQPAPAQAPPAPGATPGGGPQMGSGPMTNNPMAPQPQGLAKLMRPGGMPQGGA